MRLMLSCCSAMLLADRHGDVVHCNAEFSKLSGYEITDVQGMKFYDVMSGKGTKAESVDVMKKLLQDKKSIELQLIQHRKNDEALLNRVIVVPIYGGYMRAGKSNIVFLFHLQYEVISHCVSLLHRNNPLLFVVCHGTKS